MTETLSQEATEQNVEKAIKEYKPNAALQSAAAIMPKSFKDVMELAMVYSKSGLVPAAMVGKPEACAIAIMHGLELGVSPSQSVNNIMVVNGRPSVWGDLMLALALGSGQLEDFMEDDPALALQQGYGKCTCKRNGANNPVTRTFSLEDAKRAGLVTKDVWRNYPGRMLMFRARSWALRDCIPHVLKGLIMREEVDDYEVKIMSQPEMPKKRMETPQGSMILEGQVVPQEIEPNPIPTQSQEGDVQEPVEVDRMVDDEDRKELFKMRSEAGISIQDTKAFLKQTFGVEDTGKLTKKQADQLGVWFVKNAKK